MTPVGVGGSDISPPTPVPPPAVMESIPARLKGRKREAFVCPPKTATS
jgi:hypothetical protein